jgi:hypothetical protein
LHRELNDGVLRAIAPGLPVIRAIGLATVYSSNGTEALTLLRDILCFRKISIVKIVLIVYHHLPPLLGVESDSTASRTFLSAAASDEALMSVTT